MIDKTGGLRSARFVNTDMTDELTPEMQAHIELTRSQASHNYVPQKVEVKPKRRKLQPEVESPVESPAEESNGDHGDSA